MTKRKMMNKNFNNILFRASAKNIAKEDIKKKFTGILNYVLDFIVFLIVFMTIVLLINTAASIMQFIEKNIFLLPVIFLLLGFYLIYMHAKDDFWSNIQHQKILEIEKRWDTFSDEEKRKILAKSKIPILENKAGLWGRSYLGHNEISEYKKATKGEKIRMVRERKHSKMHLVPHITRYLKNIAEEALSEHEEVVILNDTRNNDLFADPADLSIFSVFDLPEPVLMAVEKDMGKMKIFCEINEDYLKLSC